MRVGVAPVLPFVFACGRVGFAPRDDGAVAGDAPTSDTRAIDASLCVVDPFDSLDPAYMTSGGGTVAVVNGQLETSTDGTPGTDIVILTSPNRSFMGTTMAVEIVAVGAFPDCSTGPGWHGNVESIHFHVRQGVLTLFDSGTIAVAPYDPVAHRWVRLGESNGTVYGDVSPNGVTWTRFGSRSSFDLSVSFYDLGITPNGGVPGSDKAVFDNLVTCPAP